MKEVPISDNERKTGLTWMRGVLAAVLEVSPLSYQQKKKASHFLKRMPDWMLANWAMALNIDYIGGSSRYPSLAEQAKSDTGRQLAQEYLEAHDAVPVANCLEELSKGVLKHAQAGDLPTDSEAIEKQACALALASCSAEGADFAESARDILGDGGIINKPIVDYHLALEHGDKEKLEKLDAILASGRYSQWIAERFTEGQRYLGLEPPRVIIRYGERTPQWDLLWKKLFTGGDE